MYKIVRPAVGESMRYQNLTVPGIHVALQLNSLYLPLFHFLFFFFFVREMPLSELKNKYRKMASLEKARSCWEDEYEVSSKQVWIRNRSYSKRMWHIFFSRLLASFWSKYLVCWLLIFLLIEVNHPLCI